MEINLLCSKRALPEHTFEMKRDALWVGVDRGAWILCEENVTPVFCIGDFDSVSAAEKSALEEAVEMVSYPPEKDDTDLALAVAETVKRGYRKINIYGATGGRLDHFLGALQLLQVPEYIAQGIDIRIIDNQNEIRCLPLGRTEVDADERYPYISFIPVQHPVDLILKDFKYDLGITRLTQGSTQTISNELPLENGTACVNVISGLVLMVRSTDETI